MITLEQIGVVENAAPRIEDVPSEGLPSRVRLDPRYLPAMEGLKVGEHVHVITVFHLADPDVMVASPDTKNRIGSFAIRGSARPNHIGLTVSKILAIGDDYLDLQWLDFCDGTPVLDIKRYNWRWECILSDPRQDRRHIERQLPVGTLATVLERPARNLHGEDCAMLRAVARWAAGLVTENGVWLGEPGNVWHVEGSAHALDAVMAIGGVTMGGGRLTFEAEPRDDGGALVQVTTPGGEVYRTHVPVTAGFPLAPERPEGDRVSLGSQGSGAELFCVRIGPEEYLYWAPLAGKSAVLRRVSADPWNPATGSGLARRLEELGLTAESARKRNETSGAIAAASPVGTILLVSDRCNLRCVYCYGGPARTSARRMSFGVARPVVDLVLANARDAGRRCHIAFHGSGEPTLEMPLIRQVVEYARDRATSGEGVDFSMVTNGTGSEEVARWMGENMAAVQVSVDGPGEVHDLQRPLKTGGGSIERSLRTIKILRGLGVDVLVKSTVTADSAPKLPEIVEFLSEATGLRRFHLGIVVPVPGSDPRWGAPDAEVFLAAFAAARDQASSRGVELVVSPAEATFPNIRRHYCGVTGPNLAVTPEGHFTACYQVASQSDPRWDVYHYGQVEGDECRFDSERRDAIANLDPRSHGLCADCFCRWQCGGDCLARLYRTTVTEYDVRCRVNRALVRRELEDTQRPGKRAAKRPGGSDALGC